jgi:hypothetical protein
MLKNGIGWKKGTACIWEIGEEIVIDRESKKETIFDLCNSAAQVFLTYVAVISVMH